MSKLGLIFINIGKIISPNSSMQLICSGASHIYNILHVTDSMDLNVWNCQCVYTVARGYV